MFYGSSIRQLKRTYQKMIIEQSRILRWMSINTLNDRNIERKLVVAQYKTIGDSSKRVCS